MYPLGGSMQKYVCDLCGYVYDPAAGDPDNGVEPGTPWEDVPGDWVCPDCGAGKDDFSPVDWKRFSCPSAISGKGVVLHYHNDRREEDVYAAIQMLHVRIYL